MSDTGSCPPGRLPPSSRLSVCLPPAAPAQRVTAIRALLAVTWRRITSVQLRVSPAPARRRCAALLCAALADGCSASRRRCSLTAAAALLDSLTQQPPSRLPVRTAVQPSAHPHIAIAARSDPTRATPPLPVRSAPARRPPPSAMIPTEKVDTRRIVRADGQSERSARTTTPGGWQTQPLPLPHHTVESRVSAGSRLALG